MSRKLTEEQIETFAKDGVLLVPNAVDPSWVERMTGLIGPILERPSRWASDTGEFTDGRGRALDERYLWRENAVVREFVFESGVAALVGQAMNCECLRFYFDHWFVKEPGKMNETPWHQDAPYWPFRGRQIASLWLALSEIERSSSVLELVKGSHRWGKRFKPQRFVKSDEKLTWIQQAESADGEDVPDIDAHRNDYDIFCEPLQPGDGLLFSAWIVHAATSNASTRRRAALSTRWLGDDVRWFPHPAADPIVQQGDVHLEPGSPVVDDEHFPVAWTRDER